MLLTICWSLITDVRPTPFVWVGRPLMVLFSLYIPFLFWPPCRPALRWLHEGCPFDAQRCPSQLPPNTWVSLQAFRLMCDMLRLLPIPSTFLLYYTLHSSDPVSWLSLISRPSNFLSAPFTSSYKNFKGKIFKNFIEPKGRQLFFYELGRSKFPLYWTKTPTCFKQWPRPVASAKEREVCNLFDSLPRRLPTRKILSVYKSSQRWTDFQGMLVFFIVLKLVWHTLLVNIFSLL